MLPLSGRLIAALALASSPLIGILLTVDLQSGVAAFLILVYAPLVFIDLPIAIALWVGITFVEAVPALSVGPLLTLLLIVFGWLGTLRRPDSPTRALLTAHRNLILVLVALVAWVGISVLWTREPNFAGETVGDWLTVGALFIVTVSTIRTERGIRLVLAAFVGGAVLSVGLGLAGLVPNELYSSATAFQTAGDADRLRGGSGDPNFLAAGIVPAIAIAGVLVTTTRHAVARLLLLVAIALLTIGFFAAESRGGLVAAGVALIVAMLFVRRRAILAVFVVGLVGIAAFWLALTPGSWERITTFDSQGNGRADLWEVGWEIGIDHPLAGVGAGNFRAVSPEYVRRPGELHFVRLIAERPHVVHNAYLQTLVEFGVVGLGLLLALIFGSAHAARTAAVRFAAQGRTGLADISRALIVAIAAFLAASFFISSETDPRMWALLALGPALLFVARHDQAPPGGRAQSPQSRPAPTTARSMPTA